MTALPAPLGRPPKTATSAELSSPDDAPLIERFVRFRKVKGWTQADAATRMGMSVNSLKAYERKGRTPNGPATLKLLSLMGDLKNSPAKPTPDHAA